jgi:hypothetical protein
VRDYSKNSRLAFVSTLFWENIFIENNLQKSMRGAQVLDLKKTWFKVLFWGLG